MTIRTQPSGSRHLPCARAIRPSDQLVGNSVTSAVVFTGTEYDSLGTMWSAATPSRLTAPVDGVYSCMGCANFQQDNSAYKQYRLSVNGSENVKCIMNNAWPSSVNQHASSLNCDVFMYAGHYVELWAWHNKVEGLILTGSVYQLSLSLALVVPHNAHYPDWGGA